MRGSRCALPFARSGCSAYDRTTSVAAGAGRRGVDAVLAVIALAAVLPNLLPLMGYRPLVVLSGSMSPTLDTGDLAINEVVTPSTLDVDDVVTFADAARGDVLVTHRVVEVSRRGSRYSIVTKGDNNPGAETWLVGRGEQISRLSFRVPKLGFMVTALSTPVARVMLVGLSLVLASVAILRKVWS